MGDPGDMIFNAAIAGAVAGGLCGLLPLFLGIRGDRFILGGVGLGFSMAVGALFGWFGAVPVAAVFAAIVYIVRKK